MAKKPIKLLNAIKLFLKPGYKLLIIGMVKEEGKAEVTINLKKTYPCGYMTIENC